MGEVFRARDERIGRDVAIKVLPASFAADTDRLLRFEQEARSAGTLNHPNLVTIYDIGKENGEPYIVMELLDGETLREKLSSVRPDRKKNLLAIADAADAIAAAHRAGVIHRDLKPENIIVTNSGYTKVLDFGLAKLSVQAASADASATEVKKTDPGVVLGTAGYMSPEQAQGKPADERSDIFSLGCILYEGLSGHRAFGGNSSVDTLHKIIHDHPAAIGSATPELQRIVRKCLAKDPDERYQSAKDLAIDLREAVRELGSTSYAATAAPNRNSQALLVAGLVVAAIAAALGWYAATRARPAAAPQIAIRQLTTSGDVIESAVSPDGKYVAYVTSRAGQQSLWLRQIGTAQSIELVSASEVLFWGHVFSPNGGSIYYGLKRSDSVGALYRIATLGGPSRAVLTGIDSCISFSPDGKQFAYLRRNYPGNNQSALLVANADGSGIRTVAVKNSPEVFVPLFFAGPSWSPDGGRIAGAVVRLRGGQHARLSAFDVQNGREQPISEPGWRAASQSVWAPDGHALYVIATAANDLQTRLWRVAYPSGEARAMTNGAGDYRNPSITADGKSIVVVVAAGTSRIVEMRPSGAAVLRTIGATQRDGSFGVAVAPDDRVIFTSSVDDAIELWICNADGSNRQQITSRGSLLGDPVPTRDGRVVFVAFDKGEIALWRVNVDGTGLVRLGPTTFNTTAAVTPDSKTVYFNADFGHGSLLYRMSIDGGPAVAVTDFLAGLPAISPDGRTIAASCRVGNDIPRLALIDVATGRMLKQYPEATPDGFSRFRFSPDGRTIYYNANSSLCAVDVATGGKRIVVQYEPPDAIARFDVGGDGTLFVAHGPYTRDVYQITGFD